MSPDLSALILLSGLAAVAAAAIVWQMLRCEHGPIVWCLFAVNQIYLGLAFHWRSNRVCPYPANGPAIIVANHRSPLDPMFLWMDIHRAGHAGRIRAINFMMAREYYEKPSLHWFLRCLRSIPVDRNGRDMGPAREALRRLEAGELVGIFPEGRLNTGEGLLKPAGSGVAFLALRAGVPIIPVYIHNAPQGATMVSSFYAFTRVRVTYGEPIDLSRYAGRKRSQELLDELTDLLMRRIAELGKAGSEGPEAKSRE